MDIFDFVREEKIKKLLRTRAKPSFPGAICHITQHSVGKEPLFVEDNDYLFMLYLLKKTKKEYKWDVFSFCLMPNHVHIFMRLSEDNLSKSMQRLFMFYAIYFNKKYKRKGHVFNGRFRQSLCFDESYLIAVSLYIHLNAVRAGIANDPEDYKWSSYRLYTKQVEGKQTFIDYSFILSVLNSDENKAKEIYKNMMEFACGIKIEKEEKIIESIDFFKRKMKKMFPNLFNEKTVYGDMVNEGVLTNDNIEQKIKEIMDNGQAKSPESKKARLFVVQQMQAREYNLKRIAAELGLSRQTLYRLLKNE